MVEMIVVAALGLVVGILSSVFGLGGGIIMVPGLTMVSKLSHLQAMATSMGAIAMLTLWNTCMYSRKGLVNWSVVFWLACGSSLFAFTAARLAPLLPEALLIGIMMVFLLYLAYRTFRLGTIKAREKGRKSPLRSFGIGATSGTVAGFTGIGGGGITTPLMLVSGLVVNETAAPTSNAIMIFTAVAACISYAGRGVCSFPEVGLIHADYSLLLALGSVLSSFAGARLNAVLSLRLRKMILGFILLTIGARLGLQLLW
ncbi:MAG: sulfite exporter TauE/SafE family protein [Deltaproteobacteria bacterium]|nr:sulfite exporter TauE/SafE family protein [Candidatus Anaeroferrophillus wilburensis]MBN2888718.1 sulfite exporter TauE/SafE family protein [Deltaproteobacteria bacterium]